MLQVTYEAVDDLGPGRLARIAEDRGRVHVRVAKDAPLAGVVWQLNIEGEQLLSSSHWYQLWKDEIVCRDTPDVSLRLEYLLDPDEEEAVRIREHKGLVSVHINPSLTPEQFAAAMNPVSAQFLDAGQWFQLYAGEIIDNSPEPVSKA
jgi:hypothetical protein